MDESTSSAKRCSRCGGEKPLSEFGINRATRDGRQYHCKACVREKLAQRTPERVEAERAYQAERMRMLRADPEMAAVLRSRTRKWAARNPAKRAAAQRAWREANPDKVAQYREGDREASRERARAYLRAHPEKNRDKQHRRRALLRATTYGPIDLDALWTGRCALCGDPLDRTIRHPDPLSPTIDHIVALSRGGTHTQDNLQWAHRVCNLRKYVNPN